MCTGNREGKNWRNERNGKSHLIVASHITFMNSHYRTKCPSLIMCFANYETLMNKKI